MLADKMRMGVPFLDHSLFCKFFRLIIFSYINFDEEKNESVGSHVG